jgi:sugar phosphate isomerase/epimerase
MQMVRIYKPSKTAMQSGRARTKEWVLEFEPGAPRIADPLMGWISSADTRAQVKLWFDTAEEAQAFAERHGLSFTIEQPHERKLRIKSYADNFRPDRLRS